MVKINKEVLCVFLTGLGFLCIQAAFTTIFNVQEYIFRSAQMDDPSFTTSSYVAWCIQFLSTSVTCIFAATATNKFGPRLTLFIGAVFHLIFNVQLLYLNKYLIYFGSCMRGIANGLTWTAVGRYVTQNSTKETIVRNSGINLMVVQCNKIVGNAYVLARFHDERFEYAERMEFYGAMAILCFIGCIIFASLPIALYNQPVHIVLKDSLMRTLKHFICKDNLCLLVLYAYMGLQFTFASGIYSNCIGFTSTLPLAPITRMGISGMIHGCGGLTAGLCLGIFGKKIKTKYYGVIFCFFLLLLNITLIGLNLPNDSPVNKTMKKGLINNIYVAFFCAFMFGVADTVLYSMTTSLFAFIFKDTVSEAHAMFRIINGIAVGIQFLYTRHLKLHGVISIITILAFFSLIMFCFVERKHIALDRKLKEEGKSEVKINPEEKKIEK